MDRDEMLSILKSVDIPPNLWPSAFKYKNFEYPTSGNTLNLRRLILADLQLANGFHMMSHDPPIPFYIGLTKCLEIHN